MTTSLQRDNNYVAVGGGVYDDGSGTIAPLSINHTTGRLKVTAIISDGGSFSGLQEKSLTTPNGSTQTFAFTHTPKMIFWGGALQFLNTDYTVSGTSITFTGTLTPLSGDIILNLY